MFTLSFIERFHCSSIAYPQYFFAFVYVFIFHLIPGPLPPQFFASMTTTFFLNLILSWIKGHPGDLTYAGIINFGHFPTESEHSYQWFELPIFVLLGVIGELVDIRYSTGGHW